MPRKSSEAPRSENLAEWEDFLDQEGMPAEPKQEEVPPELQAVFAEYLDAESAISAARKFADERETGLQKEMVHARLEGYKDNFDSQFARLLAERFGISRNDAQRLVDSAMGSPLARNPHEKKRDEE